MKITDEKVVEIYKYLYSLDVECFTHDKRNKDWSFEFQSNNNDNMAMYITFSFYEGRQDKLRVSCFNNRKSESECYEIFIDWDINNVKFILASSGLEHLILGNNTLKNTPITNSSFFDKQEYKFDNNKEEEKESSIEDDNYPF